jgi:hypothetical protein
MEFGSLASPQIGSQIVALLITPGVKPGWKVDARIAQVLRKLSELRAEDPDRMQMVVGATLAESDHLPISYLKLMLGWKDLPDWLLLAIRGGLSGRGVSLDV